MKLNDFLRGKPMKLRHVSEVGTKSATITHRYRYRPGSPRLTFGNCWFKHANVLRHTVKTSGTLHCICSHYFHRVEENGKGCISGYGSQHTGKRLFAQQMLHVYHFFK